MLAAGAEQAARLPCRASRACLALPGFGYHLTHAAFASPETTRKTAAAYGASAALRKAKQLWR